MQFPAARMKYMAALIKMSCKACGTSLYRDRGRVNESLKFHWNPYCSASCMSAMWRKRKSLECENKGCRQMFEKRASQILDHNFCSRSCAVTVNNQRFPKRGAGARQCARAECIQTVKNDLKYCSVACGKGVRRRFTKEQLIESLQRTSKEIGRVPAKRDVEEIRYACVYYFGSWNKAILAAGLKPNRSHNQRMYKRVMTKAKDGHLCDSVSEALIDNWFTDRHIQHTRDTPYPTTHHKADWNVSGVFVEYFGLAKDSPRYDRAIKIKRNLCRRHNIPLVEIYPDDIYPNILLERKLKVAAKSDMSLFCPPLYFRFLLSKLTMVLCTATLSTWYSIHSRRLDFGFGMEGIKIL